MAIPGKIGAVFMETSDPGTTYTKKPTTADATRTRYTINDTTLRYIDKKTTVQVYVNDVLYNQPYDIEYCGGVIVFPTALSVSDVVTVSGKSVVVSQRGGFFNWSCELSNDTAEITTFSSNGWKESTSTIKSFTASAEMYYGDSEFFLNLGKEVIVAFYVDTTPGSKKRYEGYGLISSDSLEVAVDDVINESIEFEGSGKLYYRED